MIHHVSVEVSDLRRSGDFYAATVCERLQVDALLRIGCACYTTEEEVGRLVEAVEEIAK